MKPHGVYLANWLGRDLYTLGFTARNRLSSYGGALLAMSYTLRTRDRAKRRAESTRILDLSQFPSFLHNRSGFVSCL